MGSGGDDPALAIVQRHKILEFDLIIMASDGVFDNMFDKDLVGCVLPHMDGVNFVNP